VSVALSPTHVDPILFRRRRTRPDRDLACPKLDRDVAGQSGTHPVHVQTCRVLGPSHPGQEWGSSNTVPSCTYSELTGMRPVPYRHLFSVGNGATPIPIPYRPSAWDGDGSSAIPDGEKVSGMLLSPSPTHTDQLLNPRRICMKPTHICVGPRE
jgi:hypothetical protein